jgi:hypothetical protein
VAEISKFCRDARSIARVWGIHILKQRHRRKLQLESIRAAMARPDFPKKQRSGYPAAEIILWGKCYVELNKNKHEFVVSPESIHASPNGFAGQEVPKEGEFSLSVDPKEAAEKRKQAIWVRFQKGERVSNEDKRFAGIPSYEVAEDDGRDEIAGQEGVANHIRRHFNFPCTKMDISRWLRGRNLPPNCAEHFPQAFLSGRFRKSAVDAWGQKYLVKWPGTPDLLPLKDSRTKTEDLTFERANFEFELFKKAHSDEYILRTDHENALRSAGATVWARFCRVVEQELITGLEAFLKTMEVQSPKSKVQSQDRWQKVFQAILDDARMRHNAAVDALQKEFAGQTDLTTK